MTPRQPRHHRRFGQRIWLLGLVVLAVVLTVVAVAIRTSRDDRPASIGGSPTGSPSASGTSPSPTGSPGTTQLPPTPHPIPGYLLIADRGNDRMLLVDSAKRILWRYPKPGVAPAMPFHFDDDTFFNPQHNRIISNQEEQQTIQIFSFPEGRVLWHFGHVDVRGSTPGFLDTPDDAYFRANDQISVADVGNCRIAFISQATHQVVRQFGTTRACGHAPPARLASPNGDTPMPNGGTLVTEISGSWVDGINAQGHLMFSVRAPVRYPSDAQWLGNGKILLADYSRPGHILIMTTKGKVLWKYGPPSGPGMLDHPSLALMLPNGLIAVNDDYRDRVVLISRKLNRIVWQYGQTDHPGTAPGFLNTPDGMDFLPFNVALRSPAIRRVVLPGGGGTSPSPSPSPSAGGVVVAPASFSLPAPVQRAVAVRSGGTVLIAGGLSASGSSVNGVFALDPRTGRLRSVGSLPQATHDAAGALIGGRLFVFGGGSSTSSDAVQSFDPSTGSGSIAGHLPRPLSDLSSATVAGTVYLVGGFDGVTPQRTIYSTTDGISFRAAGTLPVGLRYASVGAVGPYLVIAGGDTASGPSQEVYRFDTRTGQVTPIGRLPAPVSHAGVVALGGHVLVIGGQDASGRAVDSVTSVDPVTGAAEALAPLRRPASDAAAVSLGRTALLIGGWRGAAVRDVLEVRGS